MKRKFIFKLLIFILPLIWGFMLIDQHLSYLPTSLSVKRRELKRELPEIKLLILGNSQAQNGIDPQYFSDHAFNLANVSQSLYYDEKLLAKYIEHMPRLKYLVISISYFSLEYDLFMTPEYWRSFFYERVFHIPLDNWRLLAYPDRYSWIGLYGGEETKEIILNQFKQKLYTSTPAPLKKDEKKPPFSDESGFERINSHYEIMYKKRFDKNLKHVQNMIDLAKAHGVQVFIVTTPVFSTYSKFIDQERYHKMVSALQDISQKKNVKYINYFNDAQFVQPDFMDDDHLNQNGARKLTHLIDREIQSIPK